MSNVAGEQVGEKNPQYAKWCLVLDLLNPSPYKNDIFTMMCH